MRKKSLSSWLGRLEERSSKLAVREPTVEKGVGMRERSRDGAPFKAIAAGITLLFACGVLTGLVRAFGWRAMPVEEVVRASDLIVLGQVISKDPEATKGPHASGVFTRSTFRVEAYYKGEGPEEISLLTHGGLFTDPNGRVLEASSPDTEGVRKGEEMVAFLRSGPGGYYFVGSGGNAKRLVTTDPESGERVVKLRLSKKKYMSGPSLAWFEQRERETTADHPTAAVEAGLARKGGLIETIPVKELSNRLGEIVRGESIPPRP